MMLGAGKTKSFLLRSVQAANSGYDLDFLLLSHLMGDLWKASCPLFTMGTKGGGEFPVHVPEPSSCSQHFPLLWQGHATKTEGGPWADNGRVTSKSSQV